MIQGIGQNGLTSAALEAALRSVSERREALHESALSGLSGSPGGASAKELSFENTLLDGLQKVDSMVKRTDELPRALAVGEINDFHEVAGQVKQADIAFRFALEVRNKLIDAYRETMRMSV